MTGCPWNAALTLLLASSLVAPARGTPAAQRRPEAVLPDGTRIVIEIAATEAERQRGLMYRRSLAENAGMLFVFEAGDLHGFWMKNTLIPLDIIWLDASGTIVWIAERLPPCVADPCPIYLPQAPSLMALEVNSGSVARHRLQRGQRLTLSGVSSRD